MPMRMPTAAEIDALIAGAPTIPRRQAMPTAAELDALNREESAALAPVADAAVADQISAARPPSQAQSPASPPAPSAILPAETPAPYDQMAQGGAPAPSPSQQMSPQERDFQDWYAAHAKAMGLNPNPDAPGTQYDYRAAYEAGAEPDASGWPIDFKYAEAPPPAPGPPIQGTQSPSGMYVEPGDLAQSAPAWHPSAPPPVPNSLGNLPQQAQAPPRGNVFSRLGADVVRGMVTPGSLLDRADKLLKTYFLTMTPGTPDRPSTLEEVSGMLQEAASKPGPLQDFSAQVLYGNPSNLLGEGLQAAGQVVPSAPFFAAGAAVPGAAGVASQTAGAVSAMAAPEAAIGGAEMLGGEKSLWQYLKDVGRESATGLVLHGAGVAGESAARGAMSSPLVQPLVSPGVQAGGEQLGRYLGASAGMAGSELGQQAYQTGALPSPVDVARAAGRSLVTAGALEAPGIRGKLGEFQARRAELAPPAGPPLPAPPVVEGQAPINLEQQTANLPPVEAPPPATAPAGPVPGAPPGGRGEQAPATKEAALWKARGELAKERAAMFPAETAARTIEQQQAVAGMPSTYQNTPEEIAAYDKAQKDALAAREAARVQEVAARAAERGRRQQERRVANVPVQEERRAPSPPIDRQLPEPSGDAAARGAAAQAEAAAEPTVTYEPSKQPSPSPKYGSVDVTLPDGTVRRGGALLPIAEMPTGKVTVPLSQAPADVRSQFEQARPKSELMGEKPPAALSASDMSAKLAAEPGPTKPEPIGAMGGKELVNLPSKSTVVAPPEGAPKGAQAVAQRQINAGDRFVSSAMEQFGLTKDQAERALARLTKERVVKLDPVGGQFKLTDGRFWDKEVLLRAGNAADESNAAAQVKSKGRVIRYYRVPASTKNGWYVKEIVETPDGKQATGKTVGEKIGSKREANAEVERLNGDLRAFGEPANPTKAPVEPPQAAPAVEPKPGEVQKIPIADLNVDPDRFQFKIVHGKEGATGSLEGTSKFNPALASAILVWKDPADGKTYVVNGHNRYALAKRSGAEYMNAIPLEAKDAVEARSIGALANIAEGRGTAVDAAKFFRDTGMTADDLTGQGLKLSEKIASDGLALSYLNPTLFGAVSRGEIDQGWGVAIGSKLQDHDLQAKLITMLDKAAKKGRKINEGTVRELAEAVDAAPKESVEQQDLFGGSTRTQSYAIERADVINEIKRRLAKEKRLFKGVGQTEAAKMLARAGNVVDVARTAEIGDQAAVALGVFDKFKNLSGPIAELLNDAARGGKGAKDAADEIYPKIIDAVQETLRGGKAEGRPPGGAPPGEGPRPPEGPGGALSPPAEGGRAASQGPAPEAPGGTQRPLTLEAAVVPGLSQFIAQDVGPSVVAVAKNIAGTYGDLKRALAPATVTPQAAAGSHVIRANAALLERKKIIVRRQLERLGKSLVRNLSEAEQLDMIDRIETGRTQATPELEPVAKGLRDALDARWAEVLKRGKRAPQTVIENYFPHFWKDKIKARSILTQIFGRKPLPGPQSFRRQRSIPTTRDGIAAGLEPVTTDPIELTLMKIHEIDRFLFAQDVLREMKGQNLVRFQRATKPTPDGWARVKDQMFTVGGGLTAEGARTIRGYYIAPEPVARILDNYTSPGLRGKSWYNSASYFSNALNSAQLGMSAFHLMFTSLDAASSQMASGIEQVFRGEPVHGLKLIATTPASPLLTYLRGSRVLREYYGPGTQTPDVKRILDSYLAGGGRAQLDPVYRNSSMASFWKAFKTGNVPGAGIRAPFAAIEAFSWPIMEHIVPRMKAGVFAQMAEFELKKLGPTPTRVQVREVMAKAQDSVDNRMGQMVYDNLFWNRALKDMGLIATRSLGWNLGTIRELGGGALDWAKVPLDLAMRRSPKLTHRMAYTVAMPIVVGMAGAMLQYLMTGKRPDEIRDYYFPETGGTTADGKPERVGLASYMKDVYAFGTHPLITLGHKASPMISMVIDMLRNEDFYGGEIFHKGDLWVKDMAAYVAKQFVPFSFRNVAERKAAGEGLAKQGQSFVGIFPAPASVGRTKLEEEILKKLRNKMSQGAKTPEQMQEQTVKRQLSAEAFRGDKNLPADLREQIKAGVLSHLQAKNIQKKGKLGPLVSRFSALTAPEMLDIWNDSNPEEKKTLMPVIRAKIRRYIKKHRGMREETLGKARELGIVGAQTEAP